MADEIIYQPMVVEEEKDAFELIVRVFQKHVAPFYSKKGVEKFLGMLSPEVLCDMEKGKNSFVISAKHQNRLIGILAVIKDSHIALIFVDSRYQGDGIGKHLIDEATRICLKRNPALTAVTVSSSPNSMSFYEATGFEAQGEEVDEGGMRYISMRKTIK